MSVIALLTCILSANAEDVVTWRDVTLPIPADKVTKNDQQEIFANHDDPATLRDQFGAVKGALEKAGWTEYLEVEMDGQSMGSRWKKGNDCLMFFEFRNTSYGDGLGLRWVTPTTGKKPKKKGLDEPWKAWTAAVGTTPIYDLGPEHLGLSSGTCALVADQALALAKVAETQGWEGPYVTMNVDDDTTWVPQSHQLAYVQKDWMLQISWSDDGRHSPSSIDVYKVKRWDPQSLSNLAWVPAGLPTDIGVITVQWNGVHHFVKVAETRNVAAKYAEVLQAAGWTPLPQESQEALVYEKEGKRVLLGTQAGKLQGKVSLEEEPEKEAPVEIAPETAPI